MEPRIKEMSLIPRLKSRLRTLVKRVAWKLTARAKRVRHDTTKWPRYKRPRGASPGYLTIAL